MYHPAYYHSRRLRYRHPVCHHHWHQKAGYPHPCCFYCLCSLLAKMLQELHFHGPCRESGANKEHGFQRSAAGFRRVSQRARQLRAKARSWVEGACLSVLLRVLNDGLIFWSDFSLLGWGRKEAKLHGPGSIFVHREERAGQGSLGGSASIYPR